MKKPQKHEEVLGQALTAFETVENSRAECTGLKTAGASMPAMVITGDGSPSYLDSETGELYHNRAGAYSEALQNYVIPGAALRRLRERSEISVLDICFGLGYNSFVLINEALKADLSGTIKVLGVEINQSIIELIPQILEFELLSPLRSLFPTKLLCSGKSFLVNAGKLRIEFLLKFDCLTRLMSSALEPADYVFHDPFSPKRAPELWTVDLFKRYFEILKPRNGAVLTYSAAVAVRAGLSEAGFTVKRTAALGGKSGGSLGFCAPDTGEEFVFQELSPEETAKMTGISGVPYRDPSFTLDRKQILRRRAEEQSSHSY